MNMKKTRPSYLSVRMRGAQTRASQIKNLQPRSTQSHGKRTQLIHRRGGQIAVTRRRCGDHLCVAPTYRTGATVLQPLINAICVKAMPAPQKTTRSGICIHAN